jgi:2-oxoglutarate dehydrogenase E2 component (dihydrolipoamide succinyltransferase)
MAEITLPDLGETVTEGTITHWFKEVGDDVATGEPLFEISTDKVDTEVPSPIDGVITEIHAAEGTVVAVGAVVASASAAGEVRSDEAPSAHSSGSPPATTAGQPHEPAPSVADRSGASPLLSPAVRRLTDEYGIDVAAITGTGPGGRITREDVIEQAGNLDSQRQDLTSVTAASATVPTNAIAAPPDPAPPAGSGAQFESQPHVSTQGAGVRTTPHVAVPLSKIRRLTGEHMTRSKSTSPHALSVVEVDFANVDVARGRVKAAFRSEEGFSLTFLPFVAHAIADGLREYLHLNASIDGDDLILHRTVDLGIAVDLDHAGLVAPIIRAAETKRLCALAREISDLAARARNRQLGPDEVQGGTFTISNNGSAGSVLSVPIINQPQVAIVSTDAVIRKPIVTTVGGAEAIVARPVGNLAMSWDHRAIDGAYAAAFLTHVKADLENRDWSTEL